jgi:hypothetical protein
MAPTVGGALAADVDLLWPLRIAARCPVIAVATSHVVDTWSPTPAAATRSQTRTRWGR